MKLASRLLAMIFLSLVLTACPSKQSDTEVADEPVEGSSSANNEKSAEGATDEMQEKTNKDGDATAEPAAEEKK
jgi:outer membrane PBP1 activator LpoA protein